MSELIIVLAIFAIFLLVLFVGGLIADYILPHSRKLNKWIDTLPMMTKYYDDGEDCDGRY